MVLVSSFVISFDFYFISAKGPLFKAHSVQLITFQNSIGIELSLHPPSRFCGYEICGKFTVAEKLIEAIQATAILHCFVSMSLRVRHYSRNQDKALIIVLS
jgi:hypothetical protein